MQNRLRDAGREGAETVPEQGSRELVQQAKSPSTARSSKALFDILFYPSIFEEFTPCYLPEWGLFFAFRLKLLLKAVRILIPFQTPALQYNSLQRNFETKYATVLWLFSNKAKDSINLCKEKNKSKITALSASILCKATAHILCFYNNGTVFLKGPALCKICFPNDH